MAAAKPTTNLTAFEAFAKARRSALSGTQEGNEGAAELLARAVEVDPTFALAHYHLGAVHLVLGNRWKAAAQFRAATQVDAGIPEPYKALGDLFMSSPRRLFDQAIEAYQRAITIRPHYADAHVGLGDAKAAKGEHEAAIAHYQKALSLDPLNARVQFALGKIYYSEKGLYYEAVGAYKKAIELDQYFLEARMGLGEIYEEKGLYKDAIAEYKKVIEVEAKHTGGALQPRPGLREAGPARGHRAMGSVHRARVHGRHGEGVGGRRPAAPQEAARQVSPVRRAAEGPGPPPFGRAERPAGNPAGRLRFRPG